MRRPIKTLETLAICALTVFGLNLVPAPAMAQSRSPYATSLSLQGVNTLLANKEAHTSGLAVKRRSKISPVRISTYVPGYGRLKAVFSERRNKTWISTITNSKGTHFDMLNPILLQGHASLSRKAAGISGSKVAASLIPKGKGYQLKVIFSGSKRGRSKGLRTLELKAMVHADGKVVSKVSSVPRSVLAAVGCGVEGHSHSSNVVHTSGDVSSKATYKTLEISTEADSDWFDTFGSSSNAEIASILNTVETIYQNELGITIDIVAQHVFDGSSPYTATNSSTLLTQFLSYSNANQQLGTADAYHLFTGKDLDSNVAGLAYVGVICSSPDFSYGLTMHHRASVDYGITAHEIGHNLGAEHDPSGTLSIMSPIASDPGQTRFSAFSENQVADYLASVESCLALSEGTTPTAPASSLTVSRSYQGKDTWIVSGILKDTAGAGVPSVALTLVRNGKNFKTTTTASDGSYSFTFKERSTGRYRIGAATSPKVNSKSFTLKRKTPAKKPKPRR